MNNIYTEQDLDKLIASVEETLAKAEVLSKASLKKDAPPGMDDQDQQAPPQDAPPQDAPPMDAAPDQAPPQEDQAPPQEGEQPPMDAQAPQGDEQALEGESEDAPLSDEELSQIYGSMPPEELERHYAAIRQSLEAAYGQQGQEAPPQAGAEQAPPQDAAQASPEAPPQEGAPEEEQEMGKSEKVASLEAKIAEQEKALENIAKAFEIIAKPQRKAITDIQFIKKGEDEMSKKEYSKEEIQDWAKKVGPASLTKNEREMLNTFFLYGEGKQEIEKLINTKGGK